MLIDYYLADGQRIIYETFHEYVTLQDVDYLANMYAERRPETLPTDVFMSLPVYGQFVQSFQHRAVSVPVNSGPHVVQVWTSAGCLEVHPMPYAFKGFDVLVGRIEDYNVYDVDKVFEDIVLSGCEREE